MHVLLGMMIHLGGSVEGQIRQPKHIERRHQCTGCRQAIEQIVMRVECVGHNFVFAPEPCQWRKACNGNGTNQKETMGPRYAFTQSTHFLNILLP